MYKAISYEKYHDYTFGHNRKEQLDFTYQEIEVTTPYTLEYKNKQILKVKLRYVTATVIKFIDNEFILYFDDKNTYFLCKGIDGLVKCIQSYV